LSATQASLMLTVIFAGGAAGKLGCDGSRFLGGIELVEPV
jgi:hypothetical protein